ncbi:uncharacterized protein LOC109537470 isoform X1 [Dendroctonus ponderosae]|uniref:uncharacterized protein LOC109537470 isoform X1 n=1 Tax=Dendroctonus ponderosae TaxID=77166 RepID=UPI0020354C3B|nr:uncharacterized protein LOC109537470 isoform X1 [Dendroctonus ponderosae]XP_048521037.1 uncharacterized protein LOC109537470 isoform X1 [Dendroctonus ponderosae]XP_048521038.1 uncharacterized protein LOC109537470 isoform X1 [Dendroctonus ponderosae]KAH1024466.1 hypothetical protein HUJ05_003944 [Dendroctonus ponderosae]KAH1024467.1 hypothetical protein HUJ05_003944 [Dendroctonus ponderosae]
MKKFCNKITKKEWRITVPNLSSPVFRRSPSTLDDSDKTSKRSSGFYDFQEAQLEFDKGRSLPNSIYVDSGSSSSSSTGVDEQFQDAQDRTTCLDIKRSASENETDQEIYVDVEEPKNIDKNNSRFEYDVPKISFKFCEKKSAYPEESIYENQGPCQEAPAPDSVRCTKKTEVNITLKEPSLSSLENDPECTLRDEDIVEALRNIEEEGELLEKHPSQEFGSQSEILGSRSRESMTIVKSGSDPNLRTHDLDDEDDDDNGFYKVPRSLKVQHRLSQSMNDFDPESMNSEISKSNHSSIEHISCSQVDIARQKLAESHLNSSSNNSESFDYCRTRSQLPAKERRATLLRKPKKAIDSWNNFKTKMSHMISEQASQQRVGAFSERDKLALNLEEMYKSSKNKCKKVFQSTTKIFSPKATHRRRSVSSSDVDSPKNSSCANSPVVEKQTPTFPRPKLRASDIEYQLNTSDELNGRVSNDVSDTDNYSPMSKASELSEDKKEEFDFSTIKSAFKKKLVFVPEGQNGFEDLRRYVKQGSDFCKELATILQERADAETQYAKNLSKLSAKLSRACRDGVGGLNDAWKAVAIELETKAESHRLAGHSLLEETAKPLRNLTESQHRSRKQCETAVEKAARFLGDWRAAEAKGKKHSHACARDNEKLQDAAVIDTSKFGKQTLSKSASLIQLAHRQNSADKENAKLEGKKKKAEDAVKKADIEYYTLCVRAERARLEWESSVLKGVNMFQSLEEDRLNNLKAVLTSYLRHNNDLHPRLIEATDRLKAPIEAADPAKDLATFQTLRQTSQQVSEQLLPDFYCEHITLAMNRERRKQALVKLLHLIRQDIERERKSKNGLENLSKAIRQTPNFGSEDSQQSVVEKLYHMKSMLTYFEGARYKVQSALAELDSRPRTGHPLAPHITITRDKSGLQQSVLKVPQWLREEFFETDRSPVSEKSLKSDQSDNSDPHINDVDDHVLDEWTHRGAADGNSNQPDSDFDEFSSQCSSTDNPTETENVHPIAKCRAIYPYTPNLQDELLLSPGDILKVYRQQDDGWWLGECNGNVGIFPATYVEIMSA